MSYVVLARKWRPTRLDDLVGQEHIAQTLRNAIENQKVSHGYLFTGTRGVGKTSAARILTKALNCEQGPTPTPCGTCESCVSVTRGSSMDVLEIDGASNRGVDDVRELREQVKYAPIQGKYKVYIIDEVHMLTKEAFNALLKTLEEPPPNVVFIFATTELRKVPQTILSRVQRFDFKRIPEVRIQERLTYICEQEKIQCEPSALQLLSERADGSMRDALSLLDQVVSYTGESMDATAVEKILGIPSTQLFEQVCKALDKRDSAACFKALETAYNEGVEISEFLSGLGKYVRNLLYARQKDLNAGHLGVSESQFERQREMSKGFEDGDLIRYGKILSELMLQTKTAANPRLAVEMGLAKMASLDRVVYLSEILKSEGRPEPGPEKKKVAPAKAEAGTMAPEPTRPSPAHPDVNPDPPEATRTPPGTTQAPPEKAQVETIPGNSDLAPDGPQRTHSKFETFPQSPPKTPVQLLSDWPKLMERLGEEQPLLAGYFLETKPELKGRDPISLVLPFKKRAPWQMVQSDNENALRLSELCREYFNGAAFRVAFELHPNVLAEEKAAREKKAAKKPDPSGKPFDDLLEKEPIVKYIMEKFQGQLMN